jgi:hypothetical protein
MAPKKYLSLEEAAAQLGMSTDALNKLREKGDVRGFSDRNSWKFRGEDIEELGRRLEPDSSPEVIMLFDSDTHEVSSALSGKKPTGSIFDDDDELANQPTIKRGSQPKTSDSDVRLVNDPAEREKLAQAARPAATDRDLEMIKPTSDSDVRLIGLSGSSATIESTSDSDVRLIDPLVSATDSDVRLADSDSDVRLAPLKGSDSDVKLVGRGKKPKSGSDSDVALIPDSVTDKKPSSGSSALFTGGSSLSLTADSGIRTSSQSGIRLTRPADSGILLEGPSADSGFRLGSNEDDDFSFSLFGDPKPGETGRAQKGAPKLGSPDGAEETPSGKTGRAPQPKGAGESDTIGLLGADDLDGDGPSLLLGADEDEDPGGFRTDPEVPMLFDDEDEEATGGKTTAIPSLSSRSSQMVGADDTNEFMFDDEDSAEMDAVKKRRGKGKEMQTSALSSEGSAFDLEASSVGSSLEFDVDSDSVEDDVFDVDASDDSFEGSFESGSVDGISQVVPSRRAMLPPEEVEWGTLPVVGLGLSTLVLCVGAMIAVDLMRTVWGAGRSGVYSGDLVDMFATLWK